MRIRYNNESLYKTFIFIVILIYMFESTSLPNFSDSLLHKILLALALAIAMLYIVKRKYTLKELERLIILNSIGFICYLSSGLSGLFVTMLAITLMPNGAVDRVLKMILIEEGILFGIIAFLAIIGVLNNHAVDISKGTYVVNAFSLGFGHPNMLAAQSTSIVLLYICINRYKLKIKHYVISAMSMIAIYILSQGRTALLLGLGALIMIFISKNNKIQKRILNFLPWTYCIILVFLVFAMVLYLKLGQNMPIVRFINDGLFNGRIGLAARSLLVYPITLWGKAIDLSIWNQYQYFSLDNGQVMILLSYGILGFIAYFIIIQSVLQKIKNEKEVILGIIMVLFLIYSMYEGTMYFIGKNFAFLFLGASNNVWKSSFRKETIK